ncbi:MAG: Asp-tRNA(Asn)/Glu-tRNA(Gln) amidotransferase subunit GatB [Bacteroidia bacterium]
MTHYETVIGLEIHIQLLTKSKAYSSDPAEYGSAPNTNISPVTLGHPGTLPVFNKKALEFAVKLGLACSSEIALSSHFARKNYFYADLPKGYQITQDTTPVCTNGHITIKTADGKSKKIGLIRIHIEEDAGKSIHDQDPYDTLIDLNRAGVPLLEMVSHPDIRSGEEAFQFVTEVRKLVRYLEICDGNMEEGSMRCDANISLRPVGTEKYGNRVEVKNMNSMRNVQRAIEYEIIRQTEMLDKGEMIPMETRSFDAVKGTTFSLRSKELAHDYRYFPEPDLPPVLITNHFINEVKEKMPALPAELFEKYTTQLGLSEYDAGIITDQKDTALYFEEMIKEISNYKAAANWLMGPIRSFINDKAIHISEFTIPKKSISELISLVDEGKVSFSVASQKIFPEMINKPHVSPATIAHEMNLLQESDEGSLRQYVEQAIAKFPEKVKEYKSGKTGLIGLFMGEVMKLSKGKADPKAANQIVKEILEQTE